MSEFDPIYQLFNAIFHANLVFPSFFGKFSTLVMVMFAVLVACAFKTNLGGTEERRIERQWSNMCGTLIDRMEALLPIYAETNAAYMKAMREALTKKKSVVQLVRSIPTDVKRLSEKDYCLRDINEPQIAGTLQMQLKRLLGGNE